MDGEKSAPWPDLNLANLGGAMIPGFNRFLGRKQGTIRRIDADENKR